MQNYLCAFIAALIITQFSFSQNAQLEIEISGISEIKGKIQIAIFNDSALFPQKGKAYRVEYFDVSAQVMQVLIADLPYNDYGIVLFHDLNSDKVCNLNFIGIPKESYGFSNNVKPMLRAPSFESTKVNLNTNKN
jgi:uncharacterized protein (DUF2141 family)